MSLKATSRPSRGEGGRSMVARLWVIITLATLAVAQVSIGRADGGSDVKVVVSRDVRNGDPVAVVSAFTGTDPQVCLHVTLFDVTNSRLVRVEVYRPDGSTYRTDQIKTEYPGHGYTFTRYRTWSCLAIADHEPAFTVGRWSVRVLVDGQVAQTVGFDIIGVGAEGEAKMQARLEAMKARVEANPSDPWAHVDLANALIDLKEFNDAMTELHRALEFDPQSAHAHALLGYLYSRQGDLDKAEQSLQQATQIDDNYAWAHFQLALVYKDKNDTGKAIEHFRRVIRIAGDTSLGKTAQDELAKLGAAP